MSSALHDGSRTATADVRPRLTEFAAARQRQFDGATAAGDRKARGHFGTPPAIAEFMAGLFSSLPKGEIRVLDAGAGVGTLSAGVCQRIQRLTSPRSLSIELWETDLRLIPPLRQTMDYSREVLRAAGHELDYVVRTDDFILASNEQTLFEGRSAARFDLAILNPPYFKLRKESPQALAMSHVVHGQPNIYALFMAAAADALVPGGELVAITPRSYFNGPYFKRFRKWFFDRMAPRHIHIFESRTEAFQNDAVLQENVILLAERSGAPKDVTLTTSVGRNLDCVQHSSAAHGNVIDDRTGDRVIRVATNHFEHEIVETLDAFPQRFRTLGFEVSTGPVVTFRATTFLRYERSTDTAPLLWMHNVRPFVTRFPPKNGKPTHVVVCNESKRLLVPTQRYVLLKRFTAKEERRRLVAGIMEAKDSYSEWVGLENHLNYVYRIGTELTKAEAFGLAAFLNSALVDRYFRAISGNTQVNATEIRAMPMPSDEQLAQMGEETEKSERDRREVERIVSRTLRLPKRLAEQLCEAAQ